MSSFPDIQGFKDAQSRLRNTLGTDAAFTVHTGPAVYPPGTKVDPETGRPYDPTIRPTSVPTSVRTHKVAVVPRQPGGRVDEARSTFGGLRRGDIVTIEMDPAVYADVESAVEVVIKGLRFKIAEAHADPGLDDRYLATLELT